MQFDDIGMVDASEDLKFFERALFERFGVLFGGGVIAFSFLDGDWG